MEKKEHGGQIPGWRDQNDLSMKTDERIAKETGVGPATIKRDAKFAEAVDILPSEERKEVLSGKSGKTKKEIIEGVWSKPKGKDMILGPPSNGMQFARIAIMNLEKIREDDLERDEAFISVKEWIKNNERRKQNGTKTSSN